MSIREVGSYIGYNRVTSTSQDSASGIWSLAAAERRMRAATWPMQFGGPSSISGLELWLDASDSSTLYDATTGGSLVAADGAVARWEDKSGNARHFTQGTAANRPARKTSDINGLDAVLFDGSNDVLARSPESWAFLYPLSFFCVFRATAFTSSYNALWDFYTSTVDTTASSTGLIKSNGKSAVYTTETNGTQPAYDGDGNVTYSTATTHIFSASIANNAISSRGDGVADGSFTGSFTQRTDLGVRDLEIGASAKFSRYTEMRIAELIVYSGTLATADRDLIEGYLAAKWQ